MAAPARARDPQSVLFACGQNSVRSPMAAGLLHAMFPNTLYVRSAGVKALDLTRTLAADVEYWPTHDPTGTDGNREQKLEAYREVCDALLARIRRRFAKTGAASG
jgi:protein-tyrosine-phosphatase